MISPIPFNAVLENISPCYNQHTLPLSWRQPQTVPKGSWLSVEVKEGSVLLMKEGSLPYKLSSDLAGFIKSEEIFYLETVEHCRFYVKYYRQKMLRGKLILDRSSRQASDS